MASTPSKLDESGARIEDVRDYVKEKGHGDMARNLLLERFWPLQGDSPTDMSGMICFVALVRLIYCRLGPINRGRMDAVIRQNGLMRFAMSNFGSGESDEDDDAERGACELVHEDLEEALGRKPTFDNIAESDLVLKSLWSHNGFILYHPILWRTGRESPVWNDLPEESCDFVEAKMSLIVWDTSKHRSILEAVRAREGRFRGKLESVEEDEVDYTLAFRSPLVMRIKVEAGDRLEDFGMSDISEIRVPITNTELIDPGPEEGDADALPIRTFTKSSECHLYRLLGVVRLRAGEEEPDDVRFYDAWGDLIRPQVGRPGLESFCSPEWSIRDHRHPLMLYYTRMPDTEYPPHGPFAHMTDEYGGEKAVPAEDHEPGSDAPAADHLPVASGTPGGAGGEEPASSEAGTGSEPARSPGATPEQGTAEASSETLPPMPTRAKPGEPTESRPRETSVLEQPSPPRSRLLTYPGDGNNDRWPAGGFADDDFAVPYLEHIMRYHVKLAGPRLTLDDVNVVPNPEFGRSDPRWYLQVDRLSQPEAGCNFWFPCPFLPAQKMGKVDCSTVGLATIVQALWTIVLDYDDAGSIPSLEEQIRSLDEMNGEMDYGRPLENGGDTFIVMVRPFKPEGIRSALEALQLAARHSTAGEVIFYAGPVKVEIRHGEMSALLDVHPIVVRED